MRTKSISKNFTFGSIPKQLLIFMLPFMASNAETSAKGLIIFNTVKK